MESLPMMPSHWLMDDRWLDESDVLLPIETIASFATIQAAVVQNSTPSIPPATPQTSNSSEDGDEERTLVTKALDRRHVYQQKKRRELLELRRASAELQMQLHELTQRRKAFSIAADGSKRQATGWKGMALRQIQRRIAAETLNRELRTQIRTRHEASVSLMESLRAQMTIMNSSRVVKLDNGERSKPVMQLTEQDVWDMSMLMHDVDDMCAHASAEIERTSMPQVEATKPYSSWYSRGVTEMSGVHCATFAETIVIPHSFSEANAAMEKALNILIRNECVPVISGVAEDGCTVAVKYVWGSFEVLSISKAIDTSSRTDLAWRSVIRERGRPSGPLISERGWGCVAASHELPSSTRVQFLSLWGFEQFRASKLNRLEQHVGQLDQYVQMLVKASERETIELAQTIEDVIVDEMVARKHDELMQLVESKYH